MEYRKQIEQWRQKLRSGTLVEEDFRDALDSLNGQGQTPQQLLYLQAKTTGVDSEILGMSVVEDGQILEGPDDPDDWPYRSVLAAMKDGWRVIKFPEMALLLQESATYGLGCEFILERWGE